jgi:branched-chain amino acid transport system permease protein
MPDASRDLLAATRVRPLELAFWLATLLPFFLFPSYLVLASQIAITALFALSNRYANFAGIRPNDEFYAMAR